MSSVFWTRRAREDLSAIHAFISKDSPHYANTAVSRLIAAAARLARFPESGRLVPEFDESSIREVIRRPYRIVYRIVDSKAIHILTVHHSARRLPSTE